jgi:hypothetical protein
VALGRTPLRADDPEAYVALTLHYLRREIPLRVALAYWAPPAALVTAFLTGVFYCLAAWPK